MENMGNMGLRYSFSFSPINSSSPCVHISVDRLIHMTLDNPSDKCVLLTIIDLMVLKDMVCDAIDFYKKYNPEYEQDGNLQTIWQDS